MGSLSRDVPTRGDGFDITYVNGGSTANDFYMSVNLRTQPRIPSTSVAGQTVDSSQVVPVKAAHTARNDAGIWDLIMRGLRGGLRISAYEHEANTPIKGSAGVSGTAIPLTTTPTKVIDFTNVPADAIGVQLQAGGSNSKVLYLHTTSAGANQTTAMAELAAGQPIYIDFQEDILETDVWAAMQSGSGRIRIMWTYGGGA